jgi:hypothetical protein
MIECLNCRKQFNSRKGAIYCSRGCINKGRTNWAKGLSFPNKSGEKHPFFGKKFPERSGENHYNWIKDRTQLKKQNRRNDSAYKEWRWSIIKRDRYKCRISNDECNGKLETHHILPWAEYPELRYDTNNGILLCKHHHPRKRQEVKEKAEFFTNLIFQKC